MGLTCGSIHLRGATKEQVAANIRNTMKTAMISEGWVSVFDPAFERKSPFRAAKALSRALPEALVLAYLYFDDQEHSFVLYENDEAVCRFDLNGGYRRKRGLKAALCRAGFREQDAARLAKIAGEDVLFEQIGLLEEFFGVALYYEPDIPLEEYRRVRGREKYNAYLKELKNNSLRATLLFEAPGYFANMREHITAFRRMKAQGLYAELPDTYPLYCDELGDIRPVAEGNLPFDGAPEYLNIWEIRDHPEWLDGRVRLYTLTGELVQDTPLPEDTAGVLMHIRHIFSDCSILLERLPDSRTGEVNELIWIDRQGKALWREECGGTFSCKMHSLQNGTAFLTRNKRFGDECELLLLDPGRGVLRKSIPYRYAAFIGEVNGKVLCDAGQEYYSAEKDLLLVDSKLNYTSHSVELPFSLHDDAALTPDGRYLYAGSGAGMTKIDLTDMSMQSVKVPPDGVTVLPPIEGDGRVFAMPYMGFSTVLVYDESLHRISRLRLKGMVAAYGFLGPERKRYFITSGGDNENVVRVYGIAQGRIRRE